MKIVFMGTPEFAVPCLQRLLDDGHEITGVFTQPDKPKGRGHKLSSPPVKELALQKGLPVYQPKTLRGEDAAARIASLSPELIVVVAYGKILPSAVLEICAKGCINVHGSLLPKYRGAAPIQWSVLNGERITGVTTMYMAEGVDTGDMLLKAETEIGENETAGELYDRLSVMGAELLSETLRELEAGRLQPIPQEDALSCHAPMLSKELSALDFTRPAQALHNQIRGLSPWPCAETFLQGKRLKIYRSEIVHNNTKEPIDAGQKYAFEPASAGMPGTIVDNRAFIVRTGDGLLKLTEVQYEGSRRMGGADFLRGKHVETGECLGER